MKKIIALGLAAILVVGLVGCSISDWSSSSGVNVANIEKLSEKDANETLAVNLAKITLLHNDPPVDLDTRSYVEEMPEIDVAFPLSVKGNSQLNIEIWASTERSGTGNDGWINRVTEKFNQQGYKLPDGRTVSVSIRSIDAGAQLDYLTLTSIKPDAWSPANALWNEMALSRGVQSELALDRTVGNTAGILMKKTAYDEYMKSHDSLKLEELVAAASNGDLVLGFTNPYTSDTALNMLTQILIAIDPADPLSANAAEKFMEFQKFAPPPAYTTAQMRESAKKGFIDVMVMECQAYINEPTLSDYVFTPFGVRHDNPVYKFTNMEDNRSAVLDMWIDYITNTESQQTGTQMGFNRHDDYKGMPSLNGQQLYSAQSLWKQNKSGGKPTIAVFVADVSGSMSGARIANLQTSLLNSIQYIGEENHVGFVSYSDKVTEELPIGKFEGTQRAMFQGAIKSLKVGGNTHMYSAVLVALDMIRRYQPSVGDANYMIFVLTDGETNGGIGEDVAAKLIVSYGIPVHTIGYGKDIGAEPLKRLASFAEGFCIMVDTADVVYNMKNMFNSQM